MINCSFPDLPKLLNWTISLSKKAGTMLADFPKDQFNTSHKGEIDLLTDADLKSEAFIIESIRKEFSDHAILSEEAGANDNASDYCWIIDPLDGTTNYSRGLPFYCVSIALSINRKVVLGVIYAPELRQLFFASSQGGAFLNNNRIHVSSTSKLKEAFLVTGFPYTMHHSDIDNIDLFRAFSKRCIAVRRLGSAALDLCYVAKGIFDAYWELQLNPWDFAAGSVIVTEAGGTCTTIDNTRLDFFHSSSLLASNINLHTPMKDLIQEIHVQQ
jgi:myo-inositol-1(or 4)-monophosphatase